MRLALPLLLSLSTGCAIFKGPAQPVDTSDPGDGGADDGGGTSDGGGADGGSDGGGDTDGGFPTDTGGDGGGGDDPLCDQSISTGPPTNDCVTSTLSCDTRKIDTLKRGYALYGAAAYQAWYCGWTGGDPWSGSERVYAFEHPGTGTVTFTLDTPCAEMDLVVLRWGYFASEGTCPTESTSLISECEMDMDSGDSGQVSVYASSPADYLVIVDGVDGAEENFSLEIACP
jgi:hypothetical protein